MVSRFKGVAPEVALWRDISDTPFLRCIYYIATFAIIIMAFYGWRMFQWKTEYGGWWKLALGRRPPGAGVTSTAGATSARYTGKAAEGSTKLVEDNLLASADALGMPSSDLASGDRGRRTRACAPCEPLVRGCARAFGVSTSSHNCIACVHKADALLGPLFGDS